MTRILVALLVTVAALGGAAADQLAAGDIVVVDGDTLRAGGQQYRLMNCDAPNPIKCEGERVLSERAVARLQGLINESGEIDLLHTPCPCVTKMWPELVCRRGPKCARLTLNGKDVCDVLIAEGLARSLRCGTSVCPRPKDWCP